MERAGAAVQQRSQMQSCQAAKERPKCTSAKPFLKDWTNQLNPPLQPVSKLQHVHRNTKDVLGNVMEGAQEDGKLGAKSPQHTGHAALKKPSNTSQRAGGVRPVQPGNNVTFPASVQTRGRLPSSGPGHLNPVRIQKSAQETVTAAAPQVGSDHPPTGAPHSLNVGLQDRLVCHKENLDPQASTLSIRAFQPDGKSLGKTRVFAHRESSATTPRPVLGPKDRTSNRQAKEESVLNEFRKCSGLSPNTRTQPLQPSWFLPASATLLHKNLGKKERGSTTVRQPGTAPGGGLKHHSQPPPVRFPTTPPTLGKPQGTTNLKASLNPDVTLPWPSPMVKEVMDRKDMKVVPLEHMAASQGTGHPSQSHSVHNSKTDILEDLQSRRDQPKAELTKASGMQARHVPRIPPAADRRKQLEEWVAAKGKTYKRPPMALLQKQAVEPSCRKIKAKEKQENPEQHSQAKINNMLTECLKPTEEPVKELRGTALNNLKDGGQQLEGQKTEEPIPWESTTPCPGERQPKAWTPGLVGRSMTSLPPSIKLQVTSASRGREFLEGPELKFITPVRRSGRIERAWSRYPELLKDHDPVVSSLSEILDAEEETCFVFRKNKALPEVTELEGLSSYPLKSS